MSTATIQLNRTACVTYLQSHGAYSGHSRDGIDQLRVAVAEHQAKAGQTTGSGGDRAVPDDHPFLRYVDAELVGQPCPEGLVHTVDASGLVRAHKATCKPALPALTVWPDRVYAALCCKPRTPGATARTVYVPPSKRTA